MCARVRVCVRACACTSGSLGYRCVCVCVCWEKSNHTSSWSPTVTVCNILANMIGTLVLFSCGLRSDIVSCCVKGIKVALQWCCKPSVCTLSLQ